MIRKSLFWGLTLVLLVVIVNLILRGRRMEKQQASKPVELVQQSKPTSTRVLAPQDLEVVNSSMKPGESSARHSLRIRNNGRVAYSRIQLRFIYFDNRGKTVATRDYSVARTTGPGESIALHDIAIAGIPASAVKAQVSILYADL